VARKIDHVQSVCGNLESGSDGEMGSQRHPNWRANADLHPSGNGYARYIPAGDLQAAGPDAAAFAKPYEGVQVTIFYDRVTQAAKGHTEGDGRIPARESIPLANGSLSEPGRAQQGAEGI
jgi:hypothetical protein